MKLYSWQRLYVFEIIQCEVNPSTVIGVHSHADYYFICGKVSYYKWHQLKHIGNVIVKELLCKN